MNQRLSRKTNRPDNTVNMYIITEGTKTEPQYFNDLLNDFKKKYSNNSISRKIQIETSRSDTSFNKLYEKALRIKESDKKAFVVIVADDDDKVLTNYREYLDKCNDLSSIKKYGINCVLSCRSSESWALLHFKYTTGAKNKEELERCLINHMPSYDPGGDKIFDYGLMKDKLEVALMNAKRVRECYERDGIDPYKTNLTTNMDLLIEHIMSIASGSN